ncbi:MAG: FAD-binding oxidoreductase [Butyrivibrio sp.]|nr:FAD-binding oxidoreductase [Butyrivibrio sp.]
MVVTSGEKYFSCDALIIGAGLYGLYSAVRLAGRGLSVCVLERDATPFRRATTINQARVHMGYHYPRSLTTAMKSAGYFRRFVQDYGFAIKTDFRQIYATGAQFSWTDAAQFEAFCRDAGIRCESLSPEVYFRPGICDGAYLTEEYTYDAAILRDHLTDQLSATGAQLCLETCVRQIHKESGQWVAEADRAGTRLVFRAPFLLNATYASTNEILRAVEPASREGGVFTPFPIKYELCEIILCRPSAALQDIGFTVMDGPFFSIMPFGLTGLHSLTSVTFTPHKTCHEDLPRFACQNGRACSPEDLYNCDDCPGRPVSSWPYMSHLADKYLREEYAYTYERSLFSMKPILRSSEVDDSRPTAIRVNASAPTFISVLSGKINTVYDLDPYLDAALDNQ